MTISLLHKALLFIIGVSLASGVDQFKLDMTNPAHTCPGNWVEWQVQGRRLCARPLGTSGCVSATFTPQLSYSVIVGDVRAYQYGTPDGFTFISDLDQAYLDGISFTTGPAGNRQHLFSLAASYSKDDLNHDRRLSKCPCADSFPGHGPPPEVGNDYYCESANTGKPETHYFFSDPLFDGQGCSTHDMSCCTKSTNTGRFVKFVPPSTQPIEMRLCADQAFGDEEILVESVSLVLI